MRTLDHSICTEHHASYRQLVRCALPYAAWIAGDGPYALIFQDDEPRVRLYRTLKAAERDQAYFHAGWLIAEGHGGPTDRRPEPVTEIVHLPPLS